MQPPGHSSPPFLSPKRSQEKDEAKDDENDNPNRSALLPRRRSSEGSAGSRGSALDRYRMHAAIQRGELSADFGRSVDQADLERRMREKRSPDARQGEEVRAIMRRYTTIELSKKERAVKERKDRIGLLRERYEELKHSQLGDKAMNSYDRYMNVQGMLKRKVQKVEDTAAVQR